jgi:Leucine-rich repeat (LRR) protein
LKSINIHDQNDFKHYFTNNAVFPDVTELKIYWEGVTEIPDSINNFPNLKSLTNLFSRIRKVSANITDIKNLEELFLCVNSEVPKVIFSIQSLKKLYLSGPYEFIPPDIGNLGSISELEIAGENFKSIPEEISLLSDLNTLSITGESLEKIPDKIGLLKKLDTLRLNSMSIEHFPDSFCELTQLKELSLEHDQLKPIYTKIKSFPDYFNKFECLEVFCICGYNNSKRLIELIAHWPNLTILSLTKCELTTIPESIKNCKGLEYLYLTSNKLTTLPKWLGELDKLKILVLNNNMIEKIPIKELLKLKDLDTLTLYKNNFSEKEKENVKKHLQHKIFCKIFH